VIDLFGIDMGTIHGGLGSDHCSVYLIQQLQQGPSSKGRDGTCLNCGKSGHWARECPSKRPNNKGKPPSSNNRARLSSNRTNSAPSTWKKIAPKPGEPSTKTSEGKTWRWCEKCVRWSTTHGTQQHTGPVKAPKASSSTAPPNVQAKVHAFLWHNVIGRVSTPFPKPSPFGAFGEREQVGDFVIVKSRAIAHSLLDSPDRNWNN
jgi:hypothetical protein